MVRVNLGKWQWLLHLGRVLPLFTNTFMSSIGAYTTGFLLKVFFFFFFLRLVNLIARQSYVSLKWCSSRKKQKKKKVDTVISWKFYSELHHSKIVWNEHGKLCSNYRFTSLKKTFQPRTHGMCTGSSNDRNW